VDSGSCKETGPRQGTCVLMTIEKNRCIPAGAPEAQSPPLAACSGSFVDERLAAHQRARPRAVLGYKRLRDQPGFVRSQPAIARISRSTRSISSGKFITPAATDKHVLSEAARVTRPRGYLVLDFLNAPHTPLPSGQRSGCPIGYVLSRAVSV
jgi:hypothetical protein